ncbi:MAG: response regulator [Myxococcota bacterium]
MTAIDELRVADVMETDVHSVTAETPIREVAERMCENWISCVVVCDDARPVGIISERDVTRILAQLLLPESTEWSVAREVMSAPIVSISEDAHLSFAISEVKARVIRRLVVIHADGTLAGLVTQTDLLRAYTRELEQQRKQFRRVIAEQERAIGELTEKLRSSTVSKQELLADMSHAIRTPVTGVVGMTEMLLETKLRNDQRDCIETIASSAHALMRVVEEVLTLGELEAGRLALDPTSFDLGGTLRDLVRELEPVARENRIDLGLVLHDDRFEAVRGDAEQLRQALSSMLRDLLVLRRSQRIALHVRRVSTRGGEENVRISIVPSGRQSRGGVRGDGETGTRPETFLTHRPRGAGLGFAIAAKLVELMGGTLSVHSREDEEATFACVLPLPASRLPRTSQRPQPKPGPHEGPFAARILLVEDHPVNQKVARHILEKLGCTVDVAENGQIAVDMVATGSYDLVFMDWQMPVLDGLEATRAIRKLGEAYAELPVVALTANAIEGDRQQTLDAGMNDYVAKPATRMALCDALERWLPERARGGGG